jgi:dephospho-CoA kinase
MNRPIIIGLTGGIGMGKSTAAKIMAALGLPIYSADKAVHDLLAPGGKAVKPVGTLFPEALKIVTRKGKRVKTIDRKIIGQKVFHDPKKLKQLERILHPLVHDIESRFIARHKKAVAVVLEIPLLFETGADKRCDAVICVTAPKAVQRQRVLLRKHMTPERLKAILAQQMPNAEKLKRADYVVNTGKSVADTRQQLIAILAYFGIGGGLANYSPTLSFVLSKKKRKLDSGMTKL